MQSSTTPLSFEAPAPANIRIYLISSQTRVIGLYFCGCKYVSIFIHIYAVGSKGRIFSATECVLAVQGRSGSSKVDDFGTNRKRIYDFLLVVHCDYGPILHRSEIRRLIAKNCPFFPFLLLLSHSAPSLPMFPLEFCAEVNRQEARVMGLSSSEDRMIVA